MREKISRMKKDERIKFLEGGSSWEDKRRERRWESVKERERGKDGVQAFPSPCSQQAALNGWLCIIDLVCNGVSYDAVASLFLPFACCSACNSAIIMTQNQCWRGFIPEAVCKQYSTFSKHFFNIFRFVTRTSSHFKTCLLVISKSECVFFLSFLFIQCRFVYSYSNCWQTVLTAQATNDSFTAMKPASRFGLRRIFLFSGLAVEIQRADDIFFWIPRIPLSISVS